MIVILVNKLKTLSGYYQNVRGLRTNLNTLRFNIPLFDVDYFVFTETWLSVDINDAELDFDRYNVFRTDRS